MKFINYLTSIAGIDIFPLISLIIFFLFFTVLIIYTVKADKKRMIDIKKIPLHDSQPNE